MLDARDAMLAADVMRFGGANQDCCGTRSRSRGFGQASGHGPGTRSGAEL